MSGIPREVVTSNDDRGRLQNYVHIVSLAIRQGFSTLKVFPPYKLRIDLCATYFLLVVAAIPLPLMCLHG